MSHETEEPDLAIGQYLRPLIRYGMAGLLLAPGASKFVTFGTSVRFFESLDLPAPSILVPIVGALELGAAALLLLDRSARIAALVTVPIMVVAAGTAGPTWQNVGVLAAALVLTALDTPEVRRYT
jgi:uncharacterized membrane protein YphA (DoxX/SURF4 family)